MKLTKPRIQRTKSSVVPAGRICFMMGFPGTSSLANIRGRFATLFTSGEDVGRGGQRWVGRWVTLGKSGRVVGIWTGFSRFKAVLAHLFLHHSTQVVDFPRICTLRLFWEAMKLEKESGMSLHGFRGFGFFPWLRLALRAQSRSVGTRLAQGYARNLSAFIASFHVLSDIIAHGRPVITRFLAFYRSEPFWGARRGGAHGVVMTVERFLMCTKTKIAANLRDCLKSFRFPRDCWETAKAS